jgi:hypothetical protein
MADFACYSPEQDGPLPIGRETRFPVDTQGVEIWLEIVQWLEGLDKETRPDVIDAQLNRLRNIPRQSSPSACPRVFISHKSADKAESFRIAYLACNAGFDFWIDVLDPNLAAIIPFPNSLQKSVATALIIEMAILNCSHVLAVMTPNTKLSRWVPYEYGRVKDRTRISTQAGSWLEASVRSSGDFPEYLHLGPLLDSEPNISGWFNAELIQWRKVRNLPPAHCGGKRWIHGPTTPLK